MIGEPLFISFINLEMKKKVNSYCPLTVLFFHQEWENKRKNHLDTSAEESVRSLILRIASAAAS